MNIYRHMAREAVPDLNRLVKAQKAARDAALHTTANSDITSPNQLLNQTRHALMNGDTIDDTIGHQVLAYEQAMNERQAHKQFLLRIADELENEREALETSEADTMIGVLKPHLAEILEQAQRLHGDLQGADTAEAVLQAGTFAIEAWTELGELAGKYTDLRQAHWELLKLGWSGVEGYVSFTNGMVGMHTALRDIGALWDASEPGSKPSWPHDSLRPSHAPNADREFLLWAAANAEHVWLPTSAELAAAVHGHTKAVNSPNPLGPNSPLAKVAAGYARNRATA